MSQLPLFNEPMTLNKLESHLWDEEVQEMVDLYGEDFAEDHRFQIPAGCHWQDVRQMPANVGTALQNALRCIEAANQAHLYGVFGDAQWSTTRSGCPTPCSKT